jgi:DNA polymerase I-like protein with 3'-5' exonuclease and polymerase domains
MNPRTNEAYQLLHDGVLALATVEANGMPVDLDYCARASRKAKIKIARLKEKILDSEIGLLWKKLYGPKLNLNSPNQMCKIFFDKLKLEPTEFTETGRPALDVSALDNLQQRHSIPFLQDYVRMKKLLKADGTYLQNLSKEACGGVVRASFNLHTVQTFRSSISNPSLQNIPVRDPEIGKLIRSSVRAPEGYRVVELDYSSLEVSGQVCYSRDKNMISYIKDKTKDMHRDSAMDIFKLPKEQVSKKIRYVAKNMYVFPQFYGSYYLECARNLWDAIDRLELTLENGLPLKSHLSNMGLSERGACDREAPPVPGTFEYHIREAENIFWNERFRRFNQWRKEWYQDYVDNMYFDSLTGFRFQGYYRRNEVLNYANQGSSFHCLLWSLIQIVKEMTEKKMESYVFCQIHDSVVAMVRDEELQDYLNMAQRIMTKKIREHWKWIIVPLEIEADVSPIRGTWHQKEPWQNNDGTWEIKPKKAE